jgi:hypothetical protein
VTNHRQATATVRRVSGVVTLALLWLVQGSTLAAQTRSAAVRLPRLEIGGGISWSGVSDLGAADATMTANQAGPPVRSPFFKVVSQMAGAPGLNAWVGANLSQMVGIEGGFQYGRPDLRIGITGDAEGVKDTALTSRLITQSIVEANLLLYANGLRFDDDRTVPFLIVGGGRLRQANADRTLIENGGIYQVGVGFKWVPGLTQSRHARGAGLRLDVRYVVREGGFDFQENARRSYVTAGATALLAF